MTERVELLCFAREGDDGDEWAIAVPGSGDADLDVLARGFETAVAAANYADEMGWRVVIQGKASPVGKDCQWGRTVPGEGPLLGKDDLGKDDLGKGEG